MNLINQAVRFLEQRMLHKLERYVSSRLGSGFAATQAMLANANHG